MTAEIPLEEPTQWTSTVVGHHRLRQDIAVIRLIGDYVPFLAGQSVEVRIPQHPQLRRRLSPALPPSLDGKLEFHVRAVPGGWCSGSLVAEARPGDQWEISDPAGLLYVDEDAAEVVMFAGGTGLAPLRALLLDMSRRPTPPNTQLFFGARCPRDLYASDMLWLLSFELPWLTVVPVVESWEDPDWSDPWYESHRVNVGFDYNDMVEGTLVDIVDDLGPLLQHQVLVCGSPGMTQATVNRLIGTGTPAEAIRFEGA